MNLRLKAANTNNTVVTPTTMPAQNLLLLEWLSRLTQPGFSLDKLAQSPDINDKIYTAPHETSPVCQDWNSITHLCGYTLKDFADAGAPMPLTTAEIDYFRRNHRGTENHITRDFLTAQTDLPSPLAELYGLYRHRARLDVEAALFLAQSTQSMRVARIMGDLLAIGAFANGMEYVGYNGATYSVPCAFDTSAEIDNANREAARRLALPVDHPSHLLKLTPDEIGVLASSIAEKNALCPQEFIEKANALSEARQDVNRLPACQHFATAVSERDLTMQSGWMERLAGAYARILPGWVAHLPEIQSVIH